MVAKAINQDSAYQQAQQGKTAAKALQSQGTQEAQSTQTSTAQKQVIICICKGEK